MGSILLDGVLISIGQRFECPVCFEFKKTVDFLNRVKGGEFKSSDIICNQCFEQRAKDEKNFRTINLKKMSEQNKIYGDAFKRQPLERVEVGGFYVEHTVFKILDRHPPRSGCNYFHIKTMQNKQYSYGEFIIKELSTSMSTYATVEKVTKTTLIELFSHLSLNDIWFASFLKQDLESNWQEEIVQQIRSMNQEEAVKYVKKDFATFGKVERKLSGQKIALKSANNYYMVRDLNIYFDELEKSNSVDQAAKASIRNLDVNTLQSLIFNNVKYELK